MQIIEVKNDTAKITYNPAEKNLLPYDFIMIEDNNHKLISQVINIETDENSENNTAILKLSLFIDENDNLSYYNGYVPSKNSKLFFINSEEIISLLKEDNENINFGCLSNHPKCIVGMGLSVLNKKLYIQSDRNDKTKSVVKKIVSELNNLNKKVVIIDFNRHYNDVNGSVIKITEDLKLPLNTDAFDTILKYDIQDCPVEDKALIQSIILELREYLKSLDDKFIPFNLFKKVVDDEFLANPISGLMLLRNKLWYYAQEAIFADLKKQFDIFDSLMTDKKAIIIDACEMSEFWYEFIVKTVSELIKNECYLFFSIDDIKIEKKLIEKLYNNKNVVPVISSSYNSQYSNILKSLCANELLCKPSNYNIGQEYYSVLLNKINNDDVILYGESTLFIPLILDTKNNSISDIQLNYNEEKNENNNEVISETAENQLFEETVEKEPEIVEILDEIPDINVENIDEDTVNDDILDSDLEFLDELETINNHESANDEDIQQDVSSDVEIISDENIELEEDTNSEKHEDEIINLDDVINDITEKIEIEKAVDKKDDVNEEEAITIDDIIDYNSDADLNLEQPIVNIDEIIETEEENKEENAQKIPSDVNSEITENEDENENSEEQIEVTKEEKNPEINENINTREKQDIPVYETDLPESISPENLPFKIGDKVFHPKHGKGVIEGFANYSNKILFCQIEFENVGRRILDPRIAGIEKIV